VQKIVVIECDDWGGIRMPSKEVYDRLLKDGLSVDKNRFTRYDTLADKQDLDFLFETLCSVRDSKGRPAVMTPVSNVANPDFERIKASGFEQYFYEPFTVTLQKNGRDPATFESWKQGIREGIFVPELHGREHLTVQLWLKKLREGDRKVRLAFENEFVSVDTEGTPLPARQFRPEFFFDSPHQKSFLDKSIVSGTELFINLFGYKPTVFVPSNGIFHSSLEPAFSLTGIPFIYSGHGIPDYNTDGTVTWRRHTFGQKSPLGFRYYMRNCAFEPTDNSYTGIDFTLRQVEAAFRWHKPALISSHRVNFVGKINPANRDMGLSQLKLLLKAIVKQWRDIEFMSSRELFSLIKE